MVILLLLTDALAEIERPEKLLRIISFEFVVDFVILTTNEFVPPIVELFSITFQKAIKLSLISEDGCWELGSSFLFEAQEAKKIATVINEILSNPFLTSK